jgi:hypothetical protein
MSNILFAQKIKERETEQLRSSSAQRLVEKLLLLKNRREPSRKRWFWELLQNASDYNDSVNVILTVDNEKVVFQHDGLPFIDTDVFNLIRPDSNKKDDIRRKDNIGKFGSGFVSTHILSSHIKVKGLVKEDETHLYEFEVDLIRSNYQDKTRLIEDIDDSINQFASSIKPTTSNDGFNTSFTYYTNEHLPGITKDVESKDIDLGYLYKILPYTLCFMPKILSVRICDKRERNFEFVIKRSNKSEEGFILFNVSKNHSPIEEWSMKMFYNNDVSSCIHIKGNIVMPLPKEISKLFCGLPLIGTERIGLPIIVNSLRFEPTTEREGVEIDPSCDKQNIELLTSSIDLYHDILFYIEDNKILNAYEIVKLSNEYKGTYDSEANFKDNFVGKYKDIALDYKIFENLNGDFIKLSDAHIPLTTEKKSDKRLYEYAKELEADVLPKDYSGWQKNLEFYQELAYSYEDLAYRIEATSNVSSLGNKGKDAKRWLKECLVFLLECDKNICSNYCLLPNQLGDLKNKSSLFADKKLPAQLKRINEQTEGSNKLASELLNKNFNSLIDLREYTIKELANRIDDNIKIIYADDDSKLPEEYESCVNSLYSWIKDCKQDEETLKSYFPWFYPKRASLIVDMMTEEERNQSLKIVRSGKMESLSLLADSDLSGDEIKLVAENIDKLRSIICHRNDVVDDMLYANSEEGDYGEKIVWQELQKEYPSNQGYKVIWASKDFMEPRYDFRIEKGDKIICYYDAKTTSRGLDNADSIPFFMRKSQWLFLNQLSEVTPYYIARVFLADNNKVRYIKISTK